MDSVSIRLTQSVAIPHIAGPSDGMHYDHHNSNYIACCLFCHLAQLPFGQLAAQDQQIPEALKPWEEWALWDDANLDCPAIYSNAQDRMCFWPSRLSLTAGGQQASWEFQVHVFKPSWIPLPGSNETWPLGVVVDGESVAVVERDGKPAVQIASGHHELAGTFKWDSMPSQLAIPPQIGILALEIEGQPIARPDWDDDGRLWLQRQRVIAAEKNSLTVQVYRIFEDGIPSWLRTEIELTVSGQSREESLGWLLPDGWKLATMDSPVPVAVDDVGRVKVQVRPGKWTLRAALFRARDTREIKYTDPAEPLVEQELLGIQASPAFRVVELTGIEQVDVTQTTFPDKWRSLPVYRWNTSTTVGIDEKLRGEGLQQPEGLQISRQVWIDEDGQGATYFDSIRGRMQEIWRLDAAEGQQLGAVRVNGTGQLITANPTSGAHGVEIRERNFQLDATGRLSETRQFSATGWQADAAQARMTINLVPGWRVLALFGADASEGDWLTAWSLLDLFLLLIFSLAVFRLWGFWAGGVAFIAFGLAYHEPGAPRLTWLFLLMPIALLRVVKPGTARSWVSVWKYLALVLLILNLAPFIAYQIQSGLYPQLEIPGTNYASSGLLRPLDFAYRRSSQLADYALESRSLADEATSAAKAAEKSKMSSSNLLYNADARIQTGPAQPTWNWNQVRCSWDGPVTADQQVYPILITRGQQRLLTVVRITLLGLLAAILLGNSRFSWPFRKSSTAVMIVCGLLCGVSNFALAQEIPDADTLKLLRERLTKPADVFPHAAEIPSVTLKIIGDRVTMEAEVHTAIEVAVPLPGRVPNWSPVSVTVDDEPAKFVGRRDGYLWTVLPQGVRRVVVESLLADVQEWEWTFLLKPKYVAIEAPEWKVTGLGPSGIPEPQVFFAREQQQPSDEVDYDRKDFNSIVAVDRHIETGLLWQTRNVVSRLSASEKAISISVPLLPGENVLTSEAIVDDQSIEVRLGAGQQTYTWLSELPKTPEIRLVAPDTDLWIERWYLITSPVWNVTRTGLTPIFESEPEQLIPVWHPWPGEDVTLAFSEPQAVSGETLTVQRVEHGMSLGSRQRSTHLEVELECSLGSDFEVELGPEVNITSVQVDDRQIPVRREGASLLIPVNPGKRVVQVDWRTNQPLDSRIQGERVTLPGEAANITTLVQIPESRWVLWCSGPTRGPAVRFWIFLVFAILAAVVLGSLKLSPLRRYEWVLLNIGLTQVHISAALVVVAWLFLLSWRGTSDPSSMRASLFNLRQIGIVIMTCIAIGTLIVVVGSGLLGNPEMFIVGNGSSQTYLKWFQPQVDSQLPEPQLVSISVWFYRLLMLFWALWLAAALLRWLATGWQHFSHGGAWSRKSIVATAATPSSDPPPVTT